MRQWLLLSVAHFKPDIKRQGHAQFFVAPPLDFCHPSLNFSNFLVMINTTPPSQILFFGPPHLLEIVAPKFFNLKSENISIYRKKCP